MCVCRTTPRVTSFSLLFLSLSLQLKGGSRPALRQSKPQISSSPIYPRSLTDPRRQFVRGIGIVRTFFLYRSERRLALDFFLQVSTSRKQDFFFFFWGVLSLRVCRVGSACCAASLIVCGCWTATSGYAVASRLCLRRVLCYCCVLFER